jgi:hypothetical protein
LDIRFTKELKDLIFYLYNDVTGQTITKIGMEICDLIMDEKVYGCEYDYVDNTDFYSLLIIPEYYRIVIENSKIGIEHIIDFLMTNIENGNYCFENNELVSYFWRCAKAEEHFGEAFGGFIEQDGLKKVRIVVPLKCTQQELAGKMTKCRLLKGIY